MVRYTLLRGLIFFGCLSLLWLVGLRSKEEEVPLVVGAALLSLAISYVVLRPFRLQASASLASRVDARRVKAEASGDKDASSEDAELDAAESPDDFR
ncbi:MAG: DUF4229 domain-containing protein [Nostocoides sp.]